MRTTGIIVEYNPFHNGHAFHLSESRRVTNADVIIAVMSGHFLQRGEPAIADKWTRAQMALRNGVDLVFELPAVYATQNAQTFAYGSVSLLDQLHSVDCLCFGSESENLQAMDVLSTIMANETTEFKHTLHKHLKTGIAYPAALSLTLTEMVSPELITLPADGDFLRKPNTILGLMYMCALKQLHSPMQVYAIKRIIAEYHQDTISHSAIASATAIRKQLFSHDVNTVAPYLSQETLSILSKAYKSPVSFEDFRDIVFSKISYLDTQELRAYVDVEEGLEHRIKKSINTADSIDQLITHCVSQRYTRARIQRIITHIMLDIKKANLLTPQPTPYARVLGYTENGRKFLRHAKKRTSIPIIDMFGNHRHPYADIDITATKIYSLIETKKRFGNHLWSKLSTRDFKTPPLQV